MISEYKVRMSIAYLMLVAHFSVIVLVIVMFFYGGYSFSEMTTTVGILGPLFAGYTSAIVAYIIKHKSESEDTSRNVNPVFAGLAFATPVIFTGLLVFCTILKAHNIGFSNYDQFRTTISILEGAFAVYVGQFIHSLFEGRSEQSARARGASGSRVR
jgi:hypothetical protein